MISANTSVFVEIDHEVFAMVSFFLPLIREEQLSDSTVVQAVGLCNGRRRRRVRGGFDNNASKHLHKDKDKCHHRS